MKTLPSVGLKNAVQISASRPKHPTLLHLYEGCAKGAIRFLLRPMTYCAASPLILSGAIFSHRPYGRAVRESYILIRESWEDVLTVL